MVNCLEALAGRPYPGRFIVLGENDEGIGVAVYGITGRSASSQARRLVVRDEKRSLRVEVEVTDLDVLRTGRPELLVYPAIIADRWVSVSNGAQTGDIAYAWECDGLSALECAHRRWEFEPDAPDFTPRISGSLKTYGPHHPESKAFLGIIRRSAEGLARRAFYEVPLIQGQGEFISTYQGQNDTPLSPFLGEPVPIRIPGDSPEKTAQAFYDALAPSRGEKDFRVSVAAVYLPLTYNPSVAYINRI